MVNAQLSKVTEIQNRVKNENEEQRHKWLQDLGKLKIRVSKTQYRSKKHELRRHVTPIK